jgi:hypothetical protein
MVACSQPLATQAGLRILQAGGNAADAAVAVAAALSVTEPCCTGAPPEAAAAADTQHQFACCMLSYNVHTNMSWQPVLRACRSLQLPTSNTSTQWLDH